MPANEKLTSQERKEQARETARKIREEQVAKEKRRGFLIKLFAILVPIIVIAGVVIAVVAGNKSSTTEVIRPANSTERGVLVGIGKKLLPEVPTTPQGENKTAPAHVTIYQDYICPACKAFETGFAPEIEQVIDSGAGVIEYKTVTFLDSASAGTNYSSRAANASYCVANDYPDKFYAYNSILYANQPAEMSTGLTNDELNKLAESVGVTGLKDCIKGTKYRGWAAENNKAALDKPIEGTPTILINGKLWDKQGSFYEAVVKAGAAPSEETEETAPKATASNSASPSVETSQPAK